MHENVYIKYTKHKSSSAVLTNKVEVIELEFRGMQSILVMSWRWFGIYNVDVQLKHSQYMNYIPSI